MLRNKQKTEIKSSGGSEGIENILSRVVRGSFNPKIFAHRPEVKGMEEKDPRNWEQKV